jgi:diadenosine tetraphosphatase ApaH/serine/threonine PP2A family protein phosphatase
MKVALFSDIHSNLEALKAVLSDIEHHKMEKLYCLGDVTGYATNPSECIQLLQALKVPTLLGNHDEAVCSRGLPSEFNSHAAKGVHHSKQQLAKGQIEWLSRRPRHILLNQEITLGHANVPELRWEYVDSKTGIASTFELMTTRILFIGHTHIPAVVEQTETCPWILHIPRDLPDQTLQLNATSRYIINVGSVGQPRDRDPRACWMSFDTETLILKMHRVTYDFKPTQEKIHAAGLPEFLASRLEIGR